MEILRFTSFKERDEKIDITDFKIDRAIVVNGSNMSFLEFHTDTITAEGAIQKLLKVMNPKEDGNLYYLIKNAQRLNELGRKTTLIFEKGNHTEKLTIENKKFFWTFFAWIS